MYAAERTQSFTHLVGASLVLVGITALMTLAGLDGGTLRAVSLTLYGLLLFLLYLLSTLWRDRPVPVRVPLPIIRTPAIYLLIAGTYTPFALLVLKGQIGWWVFGFVWALALIGVLTNSLTRRSLHSLALILYLCMGWSILFALDPLIATLPRIGVQWLTVGGVFYASGLLCYLLTSRYSRCQSLWHLSMLLGCCIHYFTILVFL